MDELIQKTSPSDILVIEGPSIEQSPMNKRELVNREDEAWLETSQKWLQLHQQLEALKKEEKILRETLIQMADAQNVVRGGLRVMCSVRKGTIQYDQIPELQNVDLEKYRKEPTKVWHFKAV